MEENRRVWVPHSSEGFKAGRIVDIGSESVTVQPEDGQPPIMAPYDRVFPTEEYDTDVEDNCALMYLNEATLLNNIRMRYHKDRIYTYVANILIAVNPYFELPSAYSKETISRYNGKSLGTMPPHVFALADKAYRDMINQKKSQSVVVSGESGAGKTESTKYILKYLTESWGTHAGSIEQRIQQSNPLLEGFGNAKTVRNNNSSRFGKFVEIHFNSQNLICGAYISHYLLEKSRICGQASEERNYHIFYQLCAGAPPAMHQQLALGPPSKFRYLNRGTTRYFSPPGAKGGAPRERWSEEMVADGALSDIHLDDAANFSRTCQAMGQMGISSDQQTQIFSIVAGVLHLGNIMFEEDPEDNKGGCSIKRSSEASLSQAGQLLGLSPSDLRVSLTSRMMQAVRAGQKGTAIMKPLKPGEAQSARDALAKALYCRLFDHLVACINRSLPFASSEKYIGILDIAGFEYFQHNDFEQFCINYCNEKLQQFFNQRILKEEQVLYEKEGLGVKKIHYVDNSDCIELVELKGSGILDILDEENRLPRPVSTHFTSEVHSKNKNHYRLALPRKSKLKAHRDIRDEEGFLIRHFAGAVCYQTAQFLDKNNDALHASLLFMVVGSKNSLVTSLFEEEAAKSRTAKTGKLGFQSVGSKFRCQLAELLHKLQTTGTGFIRCIKPNSRMLKHTFEGANILAQLQCAGMHSVLDLMQQGYPSRTPFSDLYTLYKQYLPPNLARLDPRLFCKSLFKALGLDDVHFKFGLTKVFFKPGKFAEFDQMLKSDPENLALLVSKVKRWLICTRFKKAIYGTWEVIKLKNKICYRRDAIIKMQKTVRMWLCVRKFRPRYRGVQKLRALGHEVLSMVSVVSKLKRDRSSAEQKTKGLEQAISALILKIQREPMGEVAIESAHQTLVRQVNDHLVVLQKMLKQQAIAEEQERLRKIQEEMEKERKRKEAAERARQEEEERKKLKAELEAKRKMEEELRKKAEEEEKKKAVSLS